MKYIVLFILFVFTNLSFGQVKYSETFDQVLVRDMKSFQDHYLLHLDHLMNNELREYIINCDKTYCKAGLAFMNSSHEYKWIYVPEAGGISDFWEDSDFIYILNSQRSSSRVNSSANLFLLKLDKNGTLISQEKIDEIDFNRANGSFDAKFDKNGCIWKITNIPQGVQADFSKTRPGKPGKSYVIEALSLNLEKKSTYKIDGKYLYFEAFDSKPNQVSFIFSADSTSVNGKLIPGDNHSDNIPSILLFQFDSQGKLIRNKYIGSGSCSIEDIEYLGDDLIIGGSFKGNDTISNLPDCYFQSIRLRSPKSYVGKDLARNAFVASIDSNLNVNWINRITGTCDILLNSLSTSTTEVAVSFNYKDSVNIEGNKVYSLKEKREYQYADPMLCFFSAEGHLTSKEPLKCYSSAWNNVFLFPNFTAIHGTFLKSIEVYGNKLTSNSKNSVYYLTIIENEER